MDGAQWYYSSEDQQIGPVSMEDLQSRAAAGDLDAETLVWRDGMADWQPAGQVDGLLQGERSVVRRPTRAGASPPRRSRITAVNKAFDSEDWAALGKPQGIPGMVVGASLIDILGGLYTAYLGLGLWKTCDEMALEGVEQQTIDIVWIFGLLYMVFAACFVGVGITLFLRQTTARLFQIIVSSLFSFMNVWLMTEVASGSSLEERDFMTLGALFIAGAIVPMALLFTAGATDWLHVSHATSRRGPYARRSRVTRKKRI